MTLSDRQLALHSVQTLERILHDYFDCKRQLPPDWNKLEEEYLGTLAETGLVGLVGLLGLVIAGLGSLRCIRHSGTEERNLVAGAAAAFTSLAAFLLVFDASARPVTWMFLGLALAVREVAPSPRFRPVVVTL